MSRSVQPVRWVVEHGTIALLDHPPDRLTAFGGTTMANCMLCRIPTDLDETLVTDDAGRCICLHCYGAQTGHRRPRSRALCRELIAALVDLDPSAQAAPPDAPARRPHAPTPPDGELFPR